jgi:hypothetical protein
MFFIHDRLQIAKNRSECNQLKGTKMIDCNKPENTAAQLLMWHQPLGMKVAANKGSSLLIDMEYIYKS